MRRMLVAAVGRKWRPKLEEFDLSERQFGVEESRKGRSKWVFAVNLLLVLDCSNAFNMLKRVAILEEVVLRSPTRTQFVAT